MSAAWQQPGRMDNAAYSDDGSGQSLADEQRLEAKARELATESFDQRDTKARDWLRNAAAYEYGTVAGDACEAVMFAAIGAALSADGSADLSLAVDRVRQYYIDDRNEDYDADAAESLAEQDADFENAGVES